MGKPAWTPWHDVVSLRDDLKKGDLSLSFFAADIYDVMMGKARPIYQDPKEFFALTYPTYNLRELAKDVILRLSGKSDKAIRQLELTYGGGKTHTLITLYHLVSDPEKLPKIPSVQEFVVHIGNPPPKSIIAVLAFDKLDVEKGMEVRSPSGQTKWLKHPWSVLAYQIAGSEGLKLLNAEGKEVERDSAPAENLLFNLLSLPAKEKLSCLILMDEVLMYAREKIGLDSAWRSKLLNFFQYLTQAVVKVDKCGMVVSLLATDPRKSDTLGKEILQEISSILSREREETIQPVEKEDVAEILRRRFFTIDSVKDKTAFKPHVTAALKGITSLDDETRKEGNRAEERYLKSFPFHPDLTEVFYTKWTNLEGFQRTRGVLRTFALALREAEKWDQSPLVSANVFLSAPEKEDLSEAASELTGVAAREEYEGKRQEWQAILQGELGKARAIQDEFPSLRHREIEQAVFSTFLHSQPIGQKASTRDLFVLVGHTRPDKIDLERALRRWADLSWFLDEMDFQIPETGPVGIKQLPKSWRLGSRPNLVQMHNEACQHRVSSKALDLELLNEIGRLKSLTAAAASFGAKVHTLPKTPSDIEDDGDFHYAVLDIKAASSSGKPSEESQRYITETTSPDRPRVYRNAVVLAVPSKDGLEVARNAIRDYLGWEEVSSQLKEQKIDPIRQQMLVNHLRGTRDSIPDAIKQAYCLAVAVSEKDEIQAIKVSVGTEPLFQSIKSDKRVRITDKAISAEALLPGGPYDLWRENEDSRRVKDLSSAFAQFPRLPKMLNRKAIMDTLVNGCENGVLVLRLTRPDRSMRTWWHEIPDESTLSDPGLEAVLPEKSKLTYLDPDLLTPGTLPELWQKDGITLKTLYDYFSGGRSVKIEKENYEESVQIPKADAEIIDTAVREAVKRGKVWLISGPASILEEEIPAGVINSSSQLLPPPDAISPFDLVSDRLPVAWQKGTTTALSVSSALSQKIGRTLPWSSIRQVVEAAIRTRLLELDADSGSWPCDYSGAKNVKLRVPVSGAKVEVQETRSKNGVLSAEAVLRPAQIQDLADRVADLGKVAAGRDLKFRLRVELEASVADHKEIVTKINELLAKISRDLNLQ